MPDIISVAHLSKTFKDIIAVDDLSFSVPQGEVYGFLGQNGAGKSTTIRMLLTLVEPTDGQIRIFDLDLKKHRKEILKRVGAIVEKPDVYRYLSGLENLRLFAAMSGVKVSDRQLMDQLEKVGLAGRAKSKVKTYSQGMRQRLGIAIALANDPELIILDEPMNGLDPQGIADIRNLIIHLGRDMKKTLVVSSHLLGEMELIADSLLIIDKGKKVVEGTMTDLFDPAEKMVELQTNNVAETYEKLRRANLAYIFSMRGDHILFRVRHDEVPSLIRQLVRMDIDIISLFSKHSLENYFLSLTTDTQHVDSFKD